MLTEQEIAEAKEAKRMTEVIQQIITSLPEEQWITNSQKSLPNASLLAIHETIMILCGGDDY